jgi:hypothetical protein
MLPDTNLLSVSNRPAQTLDFPNVIPNPTDTRSFRNYKLLGPLSLVLPYFTFFIRSLSFRFKLFIASFSVLLYFSFLLFGSPLSIYLFFFLSFVLHFLYVFILSFLVSFFLQLLQFPGMSARFRQIIWKGYV